MKIDFREKAMCLWRFLLWQKTGRILAGSLLFGLVVIAIGCRRNGFLIDEYGVAVYNVLWCIPIAVHKLMFGCFGQGGVFQMMLGVLVTAVVMIVYGVGVYCGYVHFHGEEAKKKFALPCGVGFVTALFQYTVRMPFVFYILQLFGIGLIAYLLYRAWQSVDISESGSRVGGRSVVYVLLTEAAILAGQLALAFIMYAVILIIFYLGLRFMMQVLFHIPMPSPAAYIPRKKSPERAILDDGTVIERDGECGDRWHNVDNFGDAYRQIGTEDFQKTI